MVHGMTIELGILENLRLELRRGCLILAVLAELRTEQYGYTLRKGLTDRGIAIDEGTIYPLLRRLESQGLLLSEWRSICTACGGIASRNARKGKIIFASR